MVTYKTVMVPVNAHRRRQPDAISSRSPRYPGLPRDTESRSSPGSSSTRDFGTNTECNTCCNLKAAKDREGTKISVDKVSNHTEEDFLFWKIFAVILAIATILYLSIHVCPKWSIEDKRTTEKMGPPLLDEFVHLQDMAKQGAIMKENYFGTRENVPRVPFSERGKIDKEAARAVRALIHAFGRGRIQSGAKFWKAYLVKIGKSTRCPIDIANKTDAKCTEELLSYINMLLGGCHTDEALEILNHQLMDRLAIYNVENPLESPSTAKIQEHIDFVKEFDTTYCRPAPPEKQKHKRIQLS